MISTITLLISSAVNPTCCKSLLIASTHLLKSEEQISSNLALEEKQKKKIQEMSSHLLETNT